MRTIEWKEDYNIGVDYIDKEHRLLFSIVRKAVKLLGDGADKDAELTCREGIKFFKDYAVKHFAQEEGYMRFTGYEAYDRHKAIHDALREEILPALEKELEASAYADEAVKHFLGVLTSCLTVHIMIHDRAIARGLQEEDIHTLGKGNTSALEIGLIRAVYTVFGVEASVKNEYCDGKDMDRAVFFDAEYVSDGGAIRAVAAVEEQFACMAAGQALGILMARANDTVVSALQEMIDDFMVRMGKELKSRNRYELKRTERLNREMFLLRYGARERLRSFRLNTQWGNLTLMFFE